MLDISENLQNHLTSGATTLCTCWEIVRRDGVRLGFTDHDRSLRFNDTDFEPESGATGSVRAYSADLSVDNSEMMGLLNSDILRDEDLAAGRFDEAEVHIYRVNWRSVQDHIRVKTGIVGEIVRFNNAFRMEIRGLSHLLDQTRGRLYQRHCDANVGDARCRVDLTQASYFASGTVIETINEDLFLASITGSDFENDWFAQGQLHWQSGKNQGEQNFVKTNLSRNSSMQNDQENDSDEESAIDRFYEFALWQPPGVAIKSGDTFDVFAGCDRRSETCINKFSNIINFRGFHLMPGNDFIITIPSRGETNDGGRR